MTVTDRVRLLFPILAALLYAGLRVQDRSLVREAGRFPDQMATPMIRVTSRSGDSGVGGRKAAVLLVHGLSASKSAMMTLAAGLASSGATVYAIDLPGHGQSAATFDIPSCELSIDSSLREIRQREGPHSSLLLVGHSLGGGLALRVAQRNESVAAVVALSPAAQPVDPGRLQNALILVGEFDLPNVRRGSRFLFESLSGAALPPNISAGTFLSPDGRVKLIFLPWGDHSTTLLRPQVLQELRRRFQETGVVELSEPPGSLADMLRVVFCIALFMSTPAVFQVLMRIADRLNLRRRNTDVATAEPGIRQLPLSPATTLGQGLSLYGLGAVSALLLLKLLNPWDKLNLLGGGYLAGLLFYTGTFGMLFRPPRWKELRIGWAELFAAGGAVLYLAGVVAPFLTEYFVNVSLTWNQLWRIPFLFLSVWPIYLLDEFVLSKSQGCHFVQAMVTHASSRLILGLALLIGFFVLGNGQFLLVLILPGLTILSVLAWLLADQVVGQAANPLISSLFSSAITAYFFAVFFTRT
ncbi:MAG: alpha/beta fold hydrolase [Acidobacteriota bacterium]